jgi:exonuclease III
MRIITWNCRGLGNGPAIRGLLDVQKEEAPDILFLSKTKHDGKWMEWLRWRLEMPNMVTVDSIRARGGLALFWKKEIDVTIKSFSNYHIDSVIKEEDGLLWRFTGIYGESRSEEKEATWELLRTLRVQNDLPWLCSGGFQ